MSCADDLLAHQSSAGFEHVAAIQRTESICLALGGDARDFRLHVFVGHNDTSIDKVSNLTVLVCLAFSVPEREPSPRCTTSTYIDVGSISARHVFKAVHGECGRLVTGNVDFPIFSVSLSDDTNHEVLNCRYVLQYKG